MGNQKILDAALSHPRDARGYAADIVSKDEMKDCKDEVLRRIGRNLLLFQQIEGVVSFSSPTEASADRQARCSRNMSSPLVIRLADLARQKARPDGWLPLAMVGHQLWLHAHDEMSSLKERYGFSSLKKLVIATGLFDVQDEPTIKGGKRTVYRIRNA